MKETIAGSGGGGKCGDRFDGLFSLCEDPTCKKCIRKNGGPYVCYEK